MLQPIVHLNLRLPSLLLLQHLQLPTTIQTIDLGVVQGEEHFLHAAHVRNAVGIETTCYEAPTGVFACKGVVRAAGPVVSAAVGDVVDGAVYGEEEGECGVAAVVGF